MEVKKAENEWIDFQDKMNVPPFLVNVKINTVFETSCALVDNGCLSYATISEAFVDRTKLPFLKIAPRPVRGFQNRIMAHISKVAYFDIQVPACHLNSRRIYAYVIPDQTYDMILGLPWMDDNKIIMNTAERTLSVQETGFATYRQPVKTNLVNSSFQISEISCTEIESCCKDDSVQIFAASLYDIEKALNPKPKGDPMKLLPAQYKDYLKVFSRDEANKLPPHREMDLAILLEKDKEGNEKQPPWGPLYQMSREELLVLRKTLNELLDKNFIQESKSPAGAPVLFAKKPGGGLRFCVDYRGLNGITIKDRYPLPLIRETFRQVSKAKFFTKLDIIAAFHKLRVKEGDEWKTAFRTRFGLFEWKVCPFGVTNGPATFQRFINYILREYLDEFVSAFVDDLLIYSCGSIEDHRQKVQTVLQRLLEAGLQVDIDKCEFEVTKVKYLGYIIGEGKIETDPDKIQAIAEWQPPTSVKGVRSFLGFCNYYRDFVKDYAVVTAPLTQLTSKQSTAENIPFKLPSSALKAFELIKNLFVHGPFLAQFEYDRLTVVEADSSGYATGGVLSQYNEKGELLPCAFFSKKLLPAECNYGIADKEMLSIIRCLNEWDADLRSLSKPFVVYSDHKNLEVFTKKQRLNERQIRWAEVLGKYDFKIVHRPGKEMIVPDILSRREQDLPTTLEDHRLLFREQKLLESSRLLTEPLSPQILNTVGLHSTNSVAEPLRFPPPTPPFEDETLRQLWNEAVNSDLTYKGATKSVHNRDNCWPLEIRNKVTVQISECDIDDEGRLRFRDRIWIPESEELRTKIIQDIHDSSLSGHPGAEITTSLFNRQFFFPGSVNYIRRFVRNCQVCGRTAIWTEKKRGLLKPLPIPMRIWREISMDFITDLPKTSNNETVCLVITDRLSKGVILIPLSSFTALDVAKAFIKHFIPYHGIPTAIVSDRGVQFTSYLWSTVCKLLNITRRISTAYHPETDGSTERMNINLEAYIQAFCIYSQTDWAELLPAAALAINSRPSTTTKLSPFFMTHGYDQELLPFSNTLDSSNETMSPVAQGQLIVEKLKNASEFAQASMAVAQETQQYYANRSRQPADEFKPGDKVWLKLKNITTARPCKKLDFRNRMFTVVKSVGSHAYKLDTPVGIHPVFHVSLLRRAATDPFPSQVQDDYQPAPIVTDKGDTEYEVESLLCARTKKKRRQVFVKWKGYHDPTWEPIENFTDTIAYDHFQERYGDPMQNDGPLHTYNYKKNI